MLVFPQVLPKIGLLDPDTIQRFIEAHIGVREYCEQLLWRGGQLRENMPE